MTQPQCVLVADIERLMAWPDVDEPGRFVVVCSCEKWQAVGTAKEIAAAGRTHDDSPWRNHIVHISGKIKGST